MKCAICGQANVDGAIDQAGEYICVDCWADGSAYYEGRMAHTFLPAPSPFMVDYPHHVAQNFLDACNQRRQKARKGGE